MTTVDFEQLELLDFDLTPQCELPGHYQSSQKHFHDDGPAQWFVIDNSACPGCGRIKKNRYACDGYKRSLEQHMLARYPDCGLAGIPTMRFVPID